MTVVRNPQQLLLVKQLYEDARLLAAREDTLSLTKAVILLDLSIEQMLNNIILNLDPDFTVNETKGSEDVARRTLWGNASRAIKMANKGRLLEIRELANLHALRNLVQHSGTEPTKSETQRYLPAANNMLSGVFRDAYQLDFHNFRLWDLVPNESLRQLLRDSEYALGRGRAEICIAGCNYAHHLIIAAIRSYTKLRRFRVSSIFSNKTGGSPSFPPGFPHEARNQIQQAARQIDKVIKEGVSQFRKEIMDEIEFLEDEVVTIGVGMPLMDTRRFQKVGATVPYSISYSGSMNIRTKGKADEPEEKMIGAPFMLNYLSRLVRLVDEAYPGVLEDVKVVMPLREQRFWSTVEGEASQDNTV